MTNTEISHIALIQYAHPDNYPPTYNQANLLAGLGYRVILIYRGGTAKLPYHDNIEHVQIPYDTSSVMKSVMSFLRFIATTYKTCASRRVRLFVGYDMHGFMTAYLCAKFRRRSVPLIYHNHDISEMSHLGLMGRMVKHFELSHARFADALVLPTEGRAGYFRENAHITIHPVLVRNFAPMSFSAPRPRPGGLPARYAIYQGAIGPGHSLEEIIISAASWPADLNLVMIGAGKEEYRQYLCDKANEIGIGGKIIMLPTVPYNDLPAYTQYAELGFALYQDKKTNEAHNSTASNKAFEYLASGIPVITNDWPDFRNFFATKKWALLVDPFDPSSIASAVQYVSGADSKREVIQEIAAADFTTQYNYEKEFDRLSRLVGSLIRKYYYGG